MIAIGDVLSVVAVLGGLWLTSSATLVALAFLAPGAVARGRARIEREPGGTVWLGVLWTLVPFFGLLVAGAPFPLAKILGLVVVAGSLLVAAVGVAGVASIVGERIEGASGLSRYAATMKGAGIVAGAAQLPVVGWFLGAPLLLLIGMGAGFPAVLHLKPRRSAVPVAASIREEGR